MAQTQGVKSNVLVGLGTLYVAPEGEAAPIVTGDTITWDAAWIQVGWTEGGVEFEYTPEMNDIKVDQFNGPLDKALVGEALTIKTSMAEQYLDNLKEAIAAALRTDTAAGVSIAGLEELEVGDGTVQVVSLGFEGTPPGVLAADPAGVYRMIHVPRAVATGAVGQAYTKGDKTMIPVTWEGLTDVSLAAGKRLARIVDWEEISQ